jgi:hypothetical protein
VYDIGAVVIGGIKNDGGGGIIPNGGGTIFINGCGGAVYLPPIILL